MAIRVRDKANQTEVDVSSAEAMDGIAKGVFEPIGRVRVTRGGETGTVDAADLGGALGSGFRLIDDEEHRQIVTTREAHSASSQAIGAAEQVASGATLGLSDIAETKLFGVDPEDMRAREEALGRTKDVFYVGGALAPALLTGGASVPEQAAARGARGLARLAPSAALETGGALLERGAVRALGEGAAAKVVGGGLRAGVEGAGFGVGAQIHENVLGDREWNSELLGAAFTNGLLGAGIGAGVPLLGKIASGRAKLPMPQTRHLVAEGAGVGDDAAGAMAKFYAGTSGKKAGPIGKLGKRLFGTKEEFTPMYRAYYDRPAFARETADTFVSATNRFNTEVQALRKETEGVFKKRALAAKMPAGADAVVPRMAQKRVADLRPKLQEELAIAKAYNQGDLAREFGDVESVLRKLDDDLSKSSAVNAHVRTQEALRDIGEQIGSLRKSAGVSRGSVRALREIEPVYAGLNKTLGDAGIWGDDIAAMHTEITAANSRAMDLKRGMFKGDGSGKTTLGRVLDPNPTSTEDALSVVRSIGKPKGEAQTEAMMEVFEAEIVAAETKAKHYTDPVYADRAKRMRAAFEDYKSGLSKQVEHADLIHAMKDTGAGGSLTGLTAALGPSGATVVGGILGGAPGAAIGGLANILSRPQQTLRTLAGVRHLLESVDSGVVDSIRGVVKGMGGRTTSKGSAAAKMRTGASGLRGAVRKGVLAETGRLTASSRAERQDRVQKILDRAYQLASNPDVFAKDVGRTLFDVNEAAPALAGLTQQQAHRAAVFLAGKQPAVYSDPFSTRKPVVDQIALSKYERYIEAVADPIGTLGRVADGTITLEHAEALRSVYPKIYERTQSAVLEELGASVEEGKPVPFATRVRLGITFQIATDRSLQPRVLASLTSGPDAEMQEQAEQPMAKVRAGASKEIDAADRHMTPVGRMEDTSAA